MQVKKRKKSYRAVWRPLTAENLGRILCGFCRIIQLDIFKHRKVRCKKKHILPPQAATSPVFALLRRGKQVQWSDSGMKRLLKQNEMVRLHPPSLCELWRDKQARLLEFREDVKNTFGFE